MEQLEEQVIAEEYAIEQQIEQQYPVEPATPTTTQEHHQHADPSTAPMDVTMDKSGQPEEGVAPTDHVIGNPDADSDQWTFQGANGYCGPNSISMLVEAATGQHVSEQEVASWAISNDEMTRLPPQDDPSGIPSLHYGMLPQQAVDTLNAVGNDHGFSATLQQGDIHDLENTLKNGGEIMVEVDDQRLWHEPGQPDSGQANHFVVVTGIDPSTGTVFLNDPGSPYGKEESIPLSEFKSAWSTSDNAMIVTQSTDVEGSGGSGGGIDTAAESSPGPVLLPITLEGDRLR
jgi:predicted double-glycine peptidase